MAPTTIDPASAEQPTPLPKAKGGKAKDEASRFAVYQFETGSYEFGPHKFLPLTITAIPASLDLPADEDVPVVKVYDTLELAEANLSRLRKNFDAKKGKV